MDAIRISDGRVVSIKRMKKTDHPQEEEILQYFSSSPLATEPSNHSVPVYEVLQSPFMEDIQFLVMPYLIRIYDVKFATIGETIECLRQLFEVGHTRTVCTVKPTLIFVMFRDSASCTVIVWHIGEWMGDSLQLRLPSTLPCSDVHIMNVMMDPKPLFSEQPHPIDLSKSYDFKRRVKQYTRTGHPTTYYYIDFGLSYRFSSEEPNPLVPVAFGGDKSVPEYMDPSTPKDPYKIDVYCLGNLIREDLMGVSSALLLQHIED